MTDGAVVSGRKTTWSRTSVLYYDNDGGGGGGVMLFSDLSGGTKHLLAGSIGLAAWLVPGLLGSRARQAS